MKRAQAEEPIIKEIPRESGPVKFWSTPPIFPDPLSTPSELTHLYIIPFDSFHVRILGM
jgi:hypothetical protein